MIFTVQAAVQVWPRWCCTGVETGLSSPTEPSVWQHVCSGGRLSAEIALIFGIPQGSALGLLLFLLYMAELFDIIASLGITGHSYGDDTQVYISAPVVESQQAATRLAESIERLDRWMGENDLKLNAEKTH